MAGTLGLLMAGGSVTGALAARPDGTPGPNGHNNHGLCTAYFNGQKTGWGKNGTPGPFAALEQAAADADMSVYDWCNQFGIGGNPGQNGRFPECFDNDPNTGNAACPNN